MLLTQLLSQNTRCGFQRMYCIASLITWMIVQYQMFLKFSKTCQEVLKTQDSRSWNGAKKVLANEIVHRGMNYLSFGFLGNITGRVDLECQILILGWLPEILVLINFCTSIEKQYKSTQNDKNLLIWKTGLFTYKQILKLS